MYEDRLLEINNSLGNSQAKKYNIIKRGTREIYFVDNDRAREFIKMKFENSPLKMFVYFLIKCKLFPMRKIELDYTTFGDVIFIANTINCFNLYEREVRSFPLYKDKEKRFREMVSLMQDKLKDYCPEVTFIMGEFPYYKMELLERFNGDISLPLTKLKKMNEKTGYIHGDFCKDHILKKGNDCVFIDWECVRKGNFIEDISKMLRRHYGA